MYITFIHQIYIIRLNYKNIFKELSVQGWIVETSKVDWVKITHWGIMEAKKSLSGEGGGGNDLKKDSNRLLAEARELVGLLDILNDEISKDNFSKVERKVSQISAMTNELKSKF